MRMPNDDSRLVEQPRGLKPEARGPGALLEPALLEQIKGLLLVARRVVEGALHGLHHSPLHGLSHVMAHTFEVVAFGLIGVRCRWLKLPIGLERHLAVLVGKPGRRRQ